MTVHTPPIPALPQKNSGGKMLRRRFGQQFCKPVQEGEQLRMSRWQERQDTMQVCLFRASSLCILAHSSGIADDIWHSKPNAKD